MVHAKAAAAWRAGLVAIVCVGETRAEREAGRALDGRRRPARRLDARTARRRAAGRRLRAGLGDRHRARRRPSPISPRCTAMIRARDAPRRRQHAHPLWRLGQAEQRRRIPGAATDVDGALVGGASLEAADFWAIARRLRHRPARRNAAAHVSASSWHCAARSG